MSATLESVEMHLVGIVNTEIINVSFRLGRFRKDTLKSLTGRPDSLRVQSEAGTIGMGTDNFESETHPE